MKKIRQYDLNYEYIKTWDSITEASKVLNIHDGNIVHCCKGKCKTAGGYVWRYADNRDR